jgi:hypothetical protein
MEYRHTQFGGVIFMGVFATMVVIIILVFALPDVAVPMFALFVGLAVCLTLFYALNVEISGNVLVCRFGIGIIRKRIPLSTILTVRPVKNPWYAGWGIRWMPGQYWLWNVSGLRAVELSFADGSRFRIGTDEPEALAQAIQVKKALPD